MATNDQIMPTTGREQRRDERESESQSSDDQRTLREHSATQMPVGKPSQDTQHLENGQPWWPAAGYGPLSRLHTNGERLPAFGGEFQPGLYKPPNKKLANPAPLGLAGFALTTFLLSLINLGTRGLSAPNIVVGPAYAYGGLCQLLAGMWYAIIMPCVQLQPMANSFAGRLHTATHSVDGHWAHTVVSGSL